jgi:hypothetical protein
MLRRAGAFFDAGMGVIHCTAEQVILFPDSPAPSACAFSILASVHSTWRSAATLRFIHVSQNEKFAAYLGAFSSGNSIRDTPHN